MIPDLEKGETWLIDKPYEWTSFDVLRKLKWHLIKVTGQKKAKIGHAGTLDPLATGLLIVCVGKATKKIESLQSEEKEYTGTLVIGATTPSYDCETAIDRVFDTSPISSEELQRVAASFLGEQEQYPPDFSAKRIAGKRAYELARQGKETGIKPHRITIHEMELTRIAWPEVDFRVVCSKGTYIRSLAHDFGQRLGSGAYLKALRRTRNGALKVEDARTLPEMLELLIPGSSAQEEVSSRRAFLHSRKSGQEENE